MTTNPTPPAVAVPSSDEAPARAIRTLRLPPELDRRLQAQASRRMVSVNMLMCRALEDFLPGLEEAGL
jgi:hypothetical protein